ncbi:MAG: class I SAM-dependent methyltransferase [Acidobacteria bacterium]|nr:class I SAM-dependent methyltransferase [Acidobacteriota bacterium]
MMRKLNTEVELIDALIDVRRKVVVDVGCGSGDLVSWLAREGGLAFGIDSLDILSRNELSLDGTRALFVASRGECLPFRSRAVDVVIFFASLHHVPTMKQFAALAEGYRILKHAGIIIIVEPVAEEESYYELVRLVADESELQRHAYTVIRKAAGLGLQPVLEEYCYIERSLTDFAKLLDRHVPDAEQRSEIWLQAKVRALEMFSVDTRRQHEPIFPSICRVNVFAKDR